MPFDIDRFERAKFAPRQQSVKLDAEALAGFFGEGESPEWIVRGLSASEMTRAMDAASRQKSVEAVVRAISAGGDQVQAVRQALGLTADTPGEVAKRLEMLVMGCVSPKLQLPSAVTLAEHFTIEFLQLTNTITELTGKGSDLVKPAAASQPTQA